MVVEKFIRLIVILGALMVVNACSTLFSTLFTIPPPAIAEGMFLNLAAEAGLSGTVEIEILALAKGSLLENTTLLTISDPSLIAQIVSYLDRDLELKPRARCIAHYTLRFNLSDGDALEFGLGCDAQSLSFIRGGQGFWEGREITPPAALIDLLLGLLNPEV